MRGYKLNSSICLTCRFKSLIKSKLIFHNYRANTENDKTIKYILQQTSFLISGRRSFRVVQERRL